MRTDYFFDSNGKGRIHCCKWIPEGEPKAVLQIVHGIAEFIERYDSFAEYLNSLGYIVVAEDHMGHGKSINNGGIQGYFHGGWFTAVADSYELLSRTKAQYPNLPYILFGHSMGSFMARTILCKYPHSGISAAIICGTGWQPKTLLSIAVPVCRFVAQKVGEQNPSEPLQQFVFGSYNKRVEKPRTSFDWLTRDTRIVDEYIAHPLCGFTASAGLLREMIAGIQYIEQKKNLNSMQKDLPVLLIAGDDDPVGNYGKGVLQTEAAFQRAGMQDVSHKIYPLCRHEILNEINKEDIYQDIAEWVESKIK